MIYLTSFLRILLNNVKKVIVVTASRGKDIAYRFCQENSEHFVREEIRQQEDQRDQHDHDPEEDRASNLGMFPVAIGFEVFDSCILVMVLVLLFVN